MAGRGLARRNLIRGAAICGIALAALAAVTAQAADKVSVVTVPVTEHCALVPS